MRQLQVEKEEEMRKGPSTAQKNEERGSEKMENDQKAASQNSFLNLRLLRRSLNRPRFPLLILQNIPHPRLQPLRIPPKPPARLKPQPIHERRLPMHRQDITWIFLPRDVLKSLLIVRKQLPLAFLHLQRRRDFVVFHEKRQRYRASEQLGEIAHSESETDILEVEEGDFGAFGVGEEVFGFDVAVDQGFVLGN